MPRQAEGLAAVPTDKCLTSICTAEDLERNGMQLTCPPAPTSCFQRRLFTKELASAATLHAACLQAAEHRTAIGSGLMQLGLAPGATVGLYSVNHRGDCLPHCSFSWHSGLVASSQ